MRRVAALLAAALLLAGVVGCGGSGAEPGVPKGATLVLDFAPNAAHAGIYVGLEQGLYRDGGIDLEVRQPGASTDAPKLLEAGRVEFAILDIHDLGIARERGLDLVGLMPIVNAPLASVMVRGDGDVRRPRDLEGHTVGVTGLPSDEAVLRAVVEDDGGDYARVDKVEIGFTAVPSLIAGRVDAAVSFWNAEGVALRERGVRTREFRVDDYGAPRYPELVLAVTRATLDEREELVDDMLDEIAAGTRTALADRDATVARLVDASGADEPLVRAQLDAVAAALRPPVRLDRDALEGWARFDERFGILREAPDLERAFPAPLASGP